MRPAPQARGVLTSPPRHGAEPSGDSYSSPAVAFPRCARPPQASAQSRRAGCAFATPDGGKGMPPSLIRAAGSFLFPCPPLRRVSARRPSREAPARRVARPRKPSRIREPRPIARQRHGKSPRGGGRTHPPPSASLSISCGGRGFFSPLSIKVYSIMDEILLISSRYKIKNKSN